MYLRRLSKYLLALYWLSSDATRDGLQRAINDASQRVNLATGVVAIGVILELFEPIHDGIAWVKRIRRKRRECAQLKELSEFISLNPKDQPRKFLASPDHPTWVKVFSRLGIILVIVGVVGEWRCGQQLEDAHNAIHEYDVGKLLEASRAASQGRVWALHLRPRYTSFDHAEFVESLRGSPPQKVDVLYKPESEEAYTLAYAIALALGPGKGNAGWNVSGPRPVIEADADILPRQSRHNAPLIVRAGGSGGCGIVANPATDTSAITKALAISRALGVINGTSSNAVPRGTVRIVIGEQFN